MTTGTRLWAHVIMVGTILLGLAAPGNSFAAGLGRVMDQVVIAGKKLGHTKGRAIRDLRLMAFDAGELKAIPFQIDEITAAGTYVMLRPGGNNDRDDDNGALDNNDELVFMAKDAGDKGDPAASGLSVAAADEIALRDPVDGKEAYAYLIAFDNDPPALSPVSYMKYQELAGHDELTTPYYRLIFPKNNVFMSQIAILPEAGGNGKNFLDRIKMRSGVDMLSGLMTIDRTEEDFAHKYLGHLAGPVRVMRQTETSLVLVLSLKTPAATVIGSFFPACFEFPSVLSMPFRMDLIASDAYIRQGWDMNKNALGFKFYSNLNPGPVLMDGKMDDAEKKLAADRNTLTWGLFTGPAGTFMFKGIWDMNNSPLKAILYYEDDLSRAEPPENTPGVTAFAYRLENLLEMGNKAYPFNIVNYVVPNYDGNIEKALRVYDKPLEVKVNQ